jgi:hypothetical protein
MILLIDDYVVIGNGDLSVLKVWRVDEFAEMIL